MAEQVLTDDDHHQPGRADVLLRPGIDQAELRHVDRPRKDVRRHVNDQWGIAQLRHPIELQAADGLVAGVVQIGRAIAQLPVVLSGNREVVVRLGSRRDVHAPETTGLLDRLARPDAGIDIVGHATLGQQVQRNLGELLAGPALQEQHLVVRRNRQQIAQILLRLFGDGSVIVAAMAHFHDRQALAMPVEKLRLGALKDGFGKRSRTGTEVKGAFAHCCSLALARY